jgi:hypothetical protein
MNSILGVLIFVVTVVGIWFSYWLFMRGNTPEERVAALLPPDFRPGIFHQKGDTYVGYESEQDRLALVDWPHGKVIPAKDVRRLEPVQETTLGITHHWIAIRISDPSSPRYGIWFQFRRTKRDRWLAQLAEICKETLQEKPT